MKRKTIFRMTSALIALVMTLSTLMIFPITASAEMIFTDNVFTVNTAEDLLLVAENAATYDGCAGKTIKLGKDIDLTGATWTKISEFKGTFDGNYKKITNLTIAGTTTRLAMFDILNGATVKNLYLTGTVTQTTASDYVAMLAIESKGQTLISNVYVGGKLNPQNKSSKGFALDAGFISYVSSGTTTFEKCESAITIATTNNNKVKSGFVAATSYGSTVSFTDCVFTGYMLGNIDEAAGFVGRVGGNVNMTRCIKLGIAIDSSSMYRGGFLYLDTNVLSNGIAYNSAAPSSIVIKDCYTTKRADDTVIVGGHNTRSAGLYNVQIAYGEETVYNHQAGVSTEAIHQQASATIKTLSVGGVDTLTTENFATVCPGFTDWVVTTQKVDYYFGTAVKVCPRGVIEMEQKVDATAFGSNQFIQLKANSNDPTATDVRFVTSIATADYDKVGYLVSLNANDVMVVTNADIAATETNTVFTAILANGVVVTPDEVGSYWLALGINAIPASAADTRIYVRPYAVKDGNVTLGNIASFKLSDFTSQN